MILLGFMFSYGFFCDWFFGSPDFLDYKTNKWAWSIKQKNQKCDFAILGSSRAYRSFDMIQLSRLTNKVCINLGTNGSGYVDNYLILYLFLKNNNAINTLLLQVDIYSLNSKKSFRNAFHTHEFLPYWQDSIVKVSLNPYLDKKELFVWNWVPPIRYFKYNKYFSPQEVIRRVRLRNSDNSPFDKTLGGPTDNSLDERELQDNFIITSNQKRSLADLDIEYLNKIIALCKEHNINILAFKAPELLAHQKSILNYDDLGMKIDSILRNNDILYIKPKPSIETANNSFKDPTHLSVSGRKTFTQFFAETIINVGN